MNPGYADVENEGDHTVMHKIGVEIGGTKLQAAVGTATGEILERITAPVPEPGDARAILGWLNDVLPQLTRWADAEGLVISGIGMGFGGPVERETGRILTSHQVSGWDAFALKPWMEEKFDLPTTVANDANAAGWAEYCCGAGQGARTFCYMNIGSGIGGALVVNGTLHDGQGRGAFEMGHVYIPDPYGEAAGTYRKLETLFSGWSIEKHARDTMRLVRGTPLWTLTHGNEREITCPLIAQAAAQGDAVAEQLIDEIAHYVGLAITNSITLLHPEVFVLGGGVSLMGDVLFAPLRERIAALAFKPYGGGTKLIPAALGEDVVVVGALLLAP